jgi:ATPase subunit of ABC transporter with duplicated ATPase domains
MSSSSSSESEEEVDRKRKKKQSKGVARKKEKSWMRDEEYPELLQPKPGIEDEDAEEKYRSMKYEKRFRDYVEEQKTKKKQALDSGSEDEREFDDAVALAGADKEAEPEERPVVERDFANDDAVAFDYESGKLVVRRPLVPRWFADYNIFRPDDTVVLNGKRRTGKSFLMRKILYEMRHCFHGGLVFTATRHNGMLAQLLN